MSFYLSSSVFDLTEGKERDITHSFYEIYEMPETENDCDDFPFFQNPILQKSNLLFENYYPIESSVVSEKKSETKNVESTKLKPEKNKKEGNSILNKKRENTGRKREFSLNTNQNNEIKKKEKEKPYDKIRVDNLKRKIQVHYMSFILSFLNEIIKHFGLDKQFLKIDYNKKKDVCNKNLNKLKEKTIGEIISSEISTKYKRNDKNHNKIIVDELRENEVLRNILSQKYMTLFKEVYYKSNNRINLQQFGADEEIILSRKVEMYKDFLKNNDFDSLHIIKINWSVAQYFYPELIFLVNFN